MDIVMGFDLIKNKVFFHSPALIYSRQGCYSSPKFLSVRQISKIHRVAPGTRLKEKKKCYYLVTWGDTPETCFVSCLLSKGQISFSSESTFERSCNPIWSQEKTMDFLKPQNKGFGPL